MKININGHRIDLNKIPIYKIVHNEYSDKSIKNYIEFSSRTGGYTEDVEFKSQAEALLAYRWLLEKEKVPYHWLNGKEYDL